MLARVRYFENLFEAGNMEGFMGLGGMAIDGSEPAIRALLKKTDRPLVLQFLLTLQQEGRYPNILNPFLENMPVPDADVYPNKREYAVTLFRLAEVDNIRAEWALKDMSFSFIQPFPPPPLPVIAAVFKAEALGNASAAQLANYIPRTDTLKECRDYLTLQHSGDPHVFFILQVMHEKMKMVKAIDILLEAAPTNRAALIALVEMGIDGEGGPTLKSDQMRRLYQIPLGHLVDQFRAETDWSSLSTLMSLADVGHEEAIDFMKSYDVGTLVPHEHPTRTQVEKLLPFAGRGHKGAVQILQHIELETLLPQAADADTLFSVPALLDKLAELGIQAERASQLRLEWIAYSCIQDFVRMPQTMREQWVLSIQRQWDQLSFAAQAPIRNDPTARVSVEGSFGVPVLFIQKIADTENKPFFMGLKSPMEEIEARQRRQRK